MKLKKMISLITTVILGVATPIMYYESNKNIYDITAIAADDTEQTYNSWQEAYRTTLGDYRLSESFKNEDERFEIYDINSDGTPELFISSGEYHYADLYIYTFDNGKLIEFDNIIGAGGSAYVVPSKNYVYFRGGNQGISWTVVYEFDGIELTRVATLEDTTVAISADYYGYKFNDQKITKDQYDSYIAKYTSGSISGIGRAQSFEDLYCKVGDIYYDYYFTYYEAYSVVYDSTATEISIRNTVNGLPVTGIGSYLLSGTSVKTLNIPANIESFYYYGLNGEALTVINVDSANPYYASKDGVMYNKDMTELVKFPIARDASNYTFPQSVTEVGRYSFAWCTGTKNIVIPETIDTINEGAFYSCPNLSSITIMNPECDIYDYWNDGDGITICNTYDDTTEKGNYLGVIRGYDNSTAQEYADNFGRTFISLGSFIKYGDCNNDGYVNIADAVMLQKYLLGSGTLTNWKNADLCKDDCIDVFDMVLMRKLLIENN